jgi:intracellular sulfur oxidation DsrE/DsrF family protein
MNKQNYLKYRSIRVLLSVIACFTVLVLFQIVVSQAHAESKSLPPKDDSKSPRQILNVPAEGKYRAVYNINTNTESAGINKGLYYARGLIEAFGKQGVKPEQLDIHLVLHGAAAKSLLIDETYQMASADPFAINNNANTVEELLGFGISVEICNSAMKSSGWTEKDILPDVLIVHDGYTRIIKLQNDGYAYIGGF